MYSKDCMDYKAFWKTKNKIFPVCDNFSFSRVGISEVDLFQYTGIKDKNGRKLYFDSDIVRIVGSEYLYIARRDAFGVPFLDDCGTRIYERYEFRLNLIRGFEIIGTLQENPELLKCD